LGHIRIPLDLVYNSWPDTHPIPMRETPVGTVPKRETYVGRVLKGLNW